MKTKIIFLLMAFGIVNLLSAQNYKVDIEGNGDEFIRAHSTKQINGITGIELLLGNGGGLTEGDWRIANDGGRLKFISDNDNFGGNGTARMTITRFGRLGLGTISPATTMQIAEGEEASLSDDGYLIIGSKSGFNMVFDQNEINGRNNGVASSLYLQRHGSHLYTGSGGGNSYLAHGGGNTYTGYNGGATYIAHGGGNTYTGFNGGNTHLAYGGGKASVGGSTLNGKFNIIDDNFHLYLRNADGDVNDWYIGASSDGWAVGDDNLIFSPSNSSSASILRLKDVTDNNGTDAPVTIASAGGHRLLLDGNEIDANSSLYINHNTNENTYINPTGGKASVGSTSPWGKFHVEFTGNSTSEQCLTLESPNCSWGITPSNTNTNKNLFFRPSTNSDAVAGINSVNGAWLSFSDRRMKENIESLPSLLDKVNNIGLYSYTIIGDEEATPNIGVIAQELKEIFPELVSELDDIQAVNYGQLTVVAIKGIQELTKDNEQMKSTLLKQQTMIEQLSKQVNQLLKEHQ